VGRVIVKEIWHHYFRLVDFVKWTVTGDSYHRFRATVRKLEK